MIFMIALTVVAAMLMIRSIQAVKAGQADQDSEKLKPVPIRITRTPPGRRQR